MVVAREKRWNGWILNFLYSESSTQRSAYQTDCTALLWSTRIAIYRPTISFEVVFSPLQSNFIPKIVSELSIKNRPTRCDSGIDWLEKKAFFVLEIIMKVVCEWWNEIFCVITNFGIKVEFILLIQLRQYENIIILWEVFFFFTSSKWNFM